MTTCSLLLANCITVQTKFLSTWSKYQACSHCESLAINIYKLQEYLESLMKALYVSLPAKYINRKKLLNIWGVNTQHLYTIQ